MKELDGKKANADHFEKSRLAAIAKSVVAEMQKKIKIVADYRFVLSEDLSEAFSASTRNIEELSFIDSLKSKVGAFLDLNKNVFSKSKIEAMEKLMSAEDFNSKHQIWELQSILTEEVNEANNKKIANADKNLEAFIENEGDKEQILNLAQDLIEFLKRGAATLGEKYEAKLMPNLSQDLTSISDPEEIKKYVLNSFHLFEGQMFASQDALDKARADKDRDASQYGLDGGSTKDGNVYSKMRLYGNVRPVEGIYADPQDFISSEGVVPDLGYHEPQNKSNNRPVSASSVGSNASLNSNASNDSGVGESFGGSQNSLSSTGSGISSESWGGSVDTDATFGGVLQGKNFEIKSSGGVFAAKQFKEDLQSSKVGLFGRVFGAIKSFCNKVAGRSDGFELNGDFAKQRAEVSSVSNEVTGLPLRAEKPVKSYNVSKKPSSLVRKISVKQATEENRHDNTVENGGGESNGGGRF